MILIWVNKELVDFLVFSFSESGIRIMLLCFNEHYRKVFATPGF